MRLTTSGYLTALSTSGRSPVISTTSASNTLKTNSLNLTLRSAVDGDQTAGPEYLQGDGAVLFYTVPGYVVDDYYGTF